MLHNTHSFKRKFKQHNVASHAGGAGGLENFMRKKPVSHILTHTHTHKAYLPLQGDEEQKTDLGKQQCLLVLTAFSTLIASHFTLLQKERQYMSFYFFVLTTLFTGKKL